MRQRGGEENEYVVSDCSNNNGAISTISVMKESGRRFLLCF